jgi:hypothetical protein
MTKAPDAKEYRYEMCVNTRMVVRSHSDAVALHEEMGAPGG